MMQRSENINHFLANLNTVKLHPIPVVRAPLDAVGFRTLIRTAEGTLQEPLKEPLMGLGVYSGLGLQCRV